MKTKEEMVYTDYELLARDKFAIAILQGWLAAGECSPMVVDNSGNAEALVRRCYYLADMMEKGRNV